MEKKQRNLLHKHTPIVSTLWKIEHLGLFSVFRTKELDHLVIDEVAWRSGLFGYRRSRLPEQEQSPSFTINISSQSEVSLFQCAIPWRLCVLKFWGARHEACAPDWV